LLRSCGRARARLMTPEGVIAGQKARPTHGSQALCTHSGRAFIH
jgi:hypothetical protein